MLILMFYVQFMLFSCLLNKIVSSFKIEIATFGGLNKLSKHILKYLPFIVVDSLDIEKTEVIVLLDTNTLEQLDSWKKTIEKSMKPLIVIDHHVMYPHTESVLTFCINDEQVSSTCEIVYDLYRQALIRPNEREALALFFLGISYDTKHFNFLTLRTFRIIVDLIQIGVNVEKTLNILSTYMALPERIARLKAAK